MFSLKERAKEQLACQMRCLEKTLFLEEKKSKEFLIPGKLGTALSEYSLCNELYLKEWE